MGIEQIDIKERGGWWAVGESSRQVIANALYVVYQKRCIRRFAGRLDYTHIWPQDGQSMHDYLNLYNRESFEYWERLIHENR
jgi:hypothetical protein